MKQLFRTLYLLALLLFAFPVSSEARRELSEAEVVRLILQQNLEVLARDYDPQIAATAITEAKSQFDYQLNGKLFYNRDKNETQNRVFPNNLHDVFFEAEAAKKFPHGIESRLRVSNQRTSINFGDDPQAAAFFPGSDFFTSFLDWEIRGHLLRNRLGKSDRNRVRVAEVQKEAAREDALAGVEDQARQAVLAYWNLVTAYDFLRVADRFLEMGMEFLDRTRRKAAIGLSEDPDVLAAEVLVLQRRTEVFRAQDLIDDLQDRLKKRLDITPEERLKPLEPIKTAPIYLNQEEGMRLALENRSDYLAFRKQIEAQDIQITIDRDQKWPSLDLFSSLRLNGVDVNYADALGNTYSARNPNWAVGAQFTLFFENRLAKSRLERSKLEKLQQLIRLRDFEKNIALQLTEVFREIKLQRREVKIFTKMSRLQKEKLDIELENYGFGRSSSDIVVRFQDDFLDAEKRRLEAELRLKRAEVDLRHAIATLVPPEMKRLPHEVKQAL